jgi:hypothetical protein
MMLDRLVSLIVDREPVRAATGAAGLLIAALGLAHEFNLLETITVGQVTAIGTFLSLLAGYLARKRAWSPVSVEELVVERTTVAAGEAAASTAIDLGPSTVGPVGEITEAGIDVVSEVVDDISDTIEDENVGERGSIPMAVLILIGLFVAVIIGIAMCGDALFEDEDEENDLGWAPAVELSAASDAPPGEGPGRKDEECPETCEEKEGLPLPLIPADRGDGDDNRGGRNDNGRECADTEDCSSFSPSFEDSPIIVCVQPDACRFG